jgi:hypothetical protein
VGGGSQLRHHRDGFGTMAHHVADDQTRPAAGQRDDVVPVTADVPDNPQQFWGLVGVGQR